MKKIISSIVLLLAICLGTNAGNTSTQARKILDKAVAKINIKNGATANFTVSGGKISSQSGTLAVKGNKFHASTAGSVIWFNGKTQWTYIKKNNEVNVSTPSSAKQASMNPYTFINLYKKGYNISTVKSASGNEVHLVAQNKNAGIKEMYILVDANYNIKHVKMKQSSGWVTINISNMRSKSLADDTFTFKAKDYPKAEVIDLR